MILRNFIRAKLFILFFACEFLTGFSQTTSIDFDYLQVVEAPRGPIGFIGTSANYHIGGGSSYFGIRLNNAAVGSRAGYYTFGYQAGTRLLVSESLSLHPKFMFTSGGGAESNDGSGGFLTTALLLDYAMDQVNLGFGGQYSYVSTGIIQGWSPMVSLSFHQDFSRKP